MDTNAIADLRHCIRCYQGITADCTDAEAKVLLRELIDELEENMEGDSNHRVPAKWPAKAA